MSESNQMQRHSWFWPFLLLTACGRVGTPPPDLFPQTLASVWHRTGLTNRPVSDAPDPVPRTAVNRLQIATYEGPGKLEARAYELDSAGVALDLSQRWRPSADTIFFYHDRYFVVVKWEDADREALKAFVRDLEARMGRTAKAAPRPDPHDAVFAARPYRTGTVTGGPVTPPTAIWTVAMPSRVPLGTRKSSR